MVIVLGKLKIPFEFSRLRIESEQGITVEIVARAPFAAIRRRRIAGGPKSSIGRGIVSPRNPRRRASDFPRVAFPRFMSRLARTRDSVKAPFAVAGPGIIRLHESTNQIYTARHSDDHKILDRQRREPDAVTLAVLRGREGPHGAP